MNFSFCPRFCSGQPAGPADRSDAGCDDQAAIQEPGYFAQFYPNLDVLNGGAPTPAARLGLDPAAMQLAGAFAGLSAQSAKALIVMSDPYCNGIVEKLVALAHQ